MTPGRPCQWTLVWAGVNPPSSARIAHWQAPGLERSRRVTVTGRPPSRHWHKRPIELHHGHWHPDSDLPVNLHPSHARLTPSRGLSLFMAQHPGLVAHLACQCPLTGPASEH